MRIILACIFLIAFAPVSYADQYSSVSGRIYDSDFSGIPNAEITITCNSESAETTSGQNGDYFAMIDCPLGETVEVTAKTIGITETQNSNEGSNTGTIRYSSISGILYGAEVDIEIQNNPAIPEFPSAILPAILSIASFGIISRKL